MDIKKIKIGNTLYDIVDEGARNGLSNAQTTQVNNLIQQAVNNGDFGITEEQDPIFTAHVAYKLIGTVDNSGILTLIGV